MTATSFPLELMAEVTTAKCTRQRYDIGTVLSDYNSGDQLMTIRIRLGLILMLIAPLVCVAEALVDGAAIANEADGRNWTSYGRTYSEQRFSPLDQINADNISQLGLIWSLNLPGENGLVSTPLAVDGVLYFTGKFGNVTAVDVLSGKMIWRHDPGAIAAAGDRLRVMWGTNRGAAFWKGKVFVGTADGRLVALDANTGEQVWSTMTVDPRTPLYITGAPRVFNDKVIIGNGGAEVGAVRGYVTAYDTATGKQVWRFYIVPGNPADGFENDAMAMAAKTWTGEWWKYGGGGTVWNAITYDPEFNLIYLGTGNGAPWNQKIRSPGGGDNLFLCAIVALDADTGEYRWHYQTNPGETWDFNSAMDIVLAEIEVGEKPLKVILHAPKNGFFYIINRENGELLSAKPFAKVTWATHIDMKTGRPVEVPGARYPAGEVTMWPGPFGAHNWHPMSFNPKTGLVYIPYHDLAGYYNDTKIRPAEWRHEGFNFNVGVADFQDDIPADAGTSGLMGWNPLTQNAAWKVANPGMWNAGTMTTAGNLVFQGRADGKFLAYRADNGDKLWTFDTKLGISAPPITYQIGDTQYVSLLVGWGGGIAMAGGSLGAQHGWVYGRHPRRLLTFALDGEAKLPDTLPPQYVTPMDPPAFVIDEQRAIAGGNLYGKHCAWCHGAGAVAAGGTPDLRASRMFLDLGALEQVVLNGALHANGMPKFPSLKSDDLISLQHYVRKKARKALLAEN